MDQNGQPKSIPMDTQTLSMHLQGLHKQNQTMQQMLKSALAQAERVKQLELKVQDVEEQIQSPSRTGLSDQTQQQLMEKLIATLNETTERCQSLEIQQQKLTSEVNNFEMQMRSLTQVSNQVVGQVEVLQPSLKTSIFSVKVWLNNKPVGIRTILGMLLTIGIVQAAVGLPLAALVLGRQQQFTLEQINGQINDLELQVSKPLK